MAGKAALTLLTPMELYMNKINRLEIMLLSWVARRIVRQGCYHKTNIVKYYGIMTDAFEEQFTEDNQATRDQFLTYCHSKSIE